MKIVELTAIQLIIVIAAMTMIFMKNMTHPAWEMMEIVSGIQLALAELSGNAVKSPFVEATEKIQKR